MVNRDQKAVERFFNNSNVKVEELIEQVRAECGERCPEEHVLVLQDTSELNYNSLNGKLKVQDKDLGVLSDNRSTGIFVHAGLAIDAALKLPIGFGSISLYNHHFNRASKQERNYQTQAIEEKRSYRWLETLDKSREVLSDATKMTVIADRESDIYELFARPRGSAVELLVRSSWNRRIGQGGLIREYLEQQAWQGRLSIEIKGDNGRKKRTADLQIRWCGVDILKPSKKKGIMAAYPDQVCVQVVQVKEHPQSVPSDEEPIEWYLLTSHPVDELEDALQIVTWYTYRWWIEELFRLIKTQGFQIERSQFSTGAALKKLIVLTLQEALNVLTMKQGRDGESAAPARVCFNDEQQQVLALVEARVQGNTAKQQNSFAPHSLAWATWIIARLGGWKPADMMKKPPGVITLKRGLKRFNQQVEGWQMAQQFAINKQPPDKVVGGD